MKNTQVSFHKLISWIFKEWSTQREHSTVLRDTRRNYIQTYQPHLLWIINNYLAVLSSFSWRQPWNSTKTLCGPSRSPLIPRRFTNSRIPYCTEIDPLNRKYLLLRAWSKTFWDYLPLLLWSLSLKLIHWLTPRWRLPQSSQRCSMGLSISVNHMRSAWRRMLYLMLCVRQGEYHYHCREQSRPN